MGVDICAACGEEHEPPRGTKCKRTKLPKKVKSEVLSSGDETSGGAGTGAGTGANAGAGAAVDHVDAAVKAEPPSRVEPYYEEDEEEHNLRKMLAARECERRKVLLRAALEAGPSKETEIVAKVVHSKPTKSTKSAKSTKKKAKSEKEKAVKEVDTDNLPKKSSEKSDSSDDDDDPDESSEDSSSSSDTSSESDDEDRKSRSRRRRRKRSKFSLHKYTPDDKRLKKCTFVELIYAALCWVLKRGRRVGMEYDQLRGYVGHIAYMCMHASMNNYTDRAFRCYDKAIRDRAKDKGLKAFKMGNTALSLVHFNLNNIRGTKETRRPVRTSYGGKQFSAPIRVCYSFNYNRDGCTLKRCEYEHKCIACKSSDHSVNNCKQKKY